MQGRLPIVRLLGNGGIFEQRAQFWGQWQTQRNRRLGADAHAEAGLLLRSLGHVQQRESLRRFVFSLRRRGRFASSAKAKPCGAPPHRKRQPARRSAPRSAQYLALPRKAQVAQHRGELKFGEQFAAGFEVGRLRLHGRQIQFQRHMAIDRDQFLGKRTASRFCSSDSR